MDKIVVSKELLREDGAIKEACEQRREEMKRFVQAYRDVVSAEVLNQTKTSPYWHFQTRHGNSIVCNRPVNEEIGLYITESGNLICLYQVDGYIKQLPVLDLAAVHAFEDILGVKAVHHLGLDVLTYFPSTDRSKRLK